MALIAPSVQMYLSSFAKSFKEAQSYMGYLIFLPMLPGIVATFYPIGDRPWLAPVPILGQYALATDIMGGKPPSPLYVIVAAVAAAAFAALFLSLTTRLFSKEKIIFGR
jgi:sodium transport system permease protein